MILQDSSIVSDQLIIRLHAHPNLDTTKIKLAIKAYPGNGLKSRFRVENEIKWTGHENGILKGLLNIRLRDSESALGMLILGNQTIRRQWYIDPSRSKNVRYATVQFFDQEIRQTRQAAIESNDSRKLEPAIATLLYLLGFSVTTLIEKDAPDIIAITPSGSILILECTTKIADFSSKLGKLVDRRSGLSKSLHSSSHHSQVHAALVCNLPRDQIAVKEDELLQHGIHLATREDIAHAFDLTQIPKNPDDLLNKAAQEMINRKGARKLQG
jgi:hypothetical protein